MKTFLSILFTVGVINIATGQTIFVPDSTFERFLIEYGYDDKIDQMVDTKKINTITKLVVQGRDIIDLTGIKGFNALTELHCDNNKIRTLDLSGNPNLTRLYCFNNQLSTINLSQNTQLTLLYCWENQLDSINISRNINLTHLICSNNNIENINLAKNTLLLDFRCENNKIKSIDLSNNKQLNVFYCDQNLLTKIDLSRNATLSNFRCSSNQLRYLDLSRNSNLKHFICNNNELIYLNLKNGTNSNFDYLRGPHFNALNNPNLTCIEVDDSLWSVTNWTEIDGQTKFSNDCRLVTSIERNGNTIFQAYPNPTKDFIKIDFLNHSNIVKVILTNSFGQIIETKLYDKSEDVKIYLDSPPGIYFLTLVLDSDKRQTIKVVKE